MSKMTAKYDPHLIEQQAQTQWEQQKCFHVKEDPNREKFYCLAMFPYPSGALHMGHIRNYTLADVIARYQGMKGKNVLQPIGWDAFGLPAENAAIKHKVPPAEWTYKNIAIMKRQMKRLGNSYDWSREITTCDPSYYRWEQWFFIQLYKKGLVYKRNALVNWDPVDKTVLANEQVIDGRGWRSGALIEHREIPQWFLKITDYADELLRSLGQLEGWPEQVKTMQRNWIGRSEGAVVRFKLVQKNTDGISHFDVFTTRPDTLFGATYLAIAIDHPLAKQLAKDSSKVEQFIGTCKNIQIAEAQIANIEKRGIDTGISAIHPITGEHLPIWVANYVLMEYGSGAVMAVPAHDQRDFEFARKYQLPIKQVITAKGDRNIDIEQGAYTDKGVLIHSGQFNGMDFKAAFTAIVDYLQKNNLGNKQIHYRLKDWGISRQRYWGTPIPMIYCSDCGTLPVPEEQLPVMLPEAIEFSRGGSPLKTNSAFIDTICPQCKKNATRETDTFDTFFESSWYFLRFACPDQQNKMLDARASYWSPVDHYVGGIEHAILHLLYARFFYKLLRDLGLVNDDEPFKQLLTQGMVLKGGIKMSKSKGNTVDPEALIDKYGADTVRLFIIFAAPPEQSLEWSDQGIEGAYRFLKRFWVLAHTHQDAIIALNKAVPTDAQQALDWNLASKSCKQLRRDIYHLFSQIEYDYERHQFNTIVSSSMKLFNHLTKVSLSPTDPYACLLIHEGLSILIRVLAPITPHISHHLWQQLEYGSSIHTTSWPQVSELGKIEADTIELIVQVNGKLKGQVQVSIDAKKSEIIDIVKNDPAISQFLSTQIINKIIVLPQRKLINFVVSQLPNNNG